MKEFTSPPTEDDVPLSSEDEPLTHKDLAADELEAAEHMTETETPYLMLPFVGNYVNRLANKPRRNCATATDVSMGKMKTQYTNQRAYLLPSPRLVHGKTWYRPTTYRAYQIHQ